MPEETKYIPCSFSPGMFSSEYVVIFQMGGLSLSLFAPADSVLVTNPASGEGLLRVHVIDSRNNVIALPGDISETGRRYIEYPLEQLRSA